MINRLDVSRFDAVCDPQVVRPRLERVLGRRRGTRVELVGFEVPRAFPRKQGGLTLELRAKLRRQGSADLDLLLGGHLLGASEAWPEYAATHADHVLCIEALRLVVPLFPFDPRLRFLPQLLRADRALALLRAAGVRGLEGVERLDPRVLGYRLERRCVVRYRVVGAHGTRVPLVLKVFGPNRLAALLDATRVLATAGATDLAPESRFLDAALGFHVMEAAGGRSLRDLVATPAFVSGCEAAGQALARLHTLPKEDLPERRVEDALRPLAELVDLVRDIIPQWWKELRAVHDAVRARRPEDLEPPHTRAVHGDFYDKQVLYAAGRATILDWDGFACGDPAQDRGNFRAQVALRALQTPRHAVQIELGAAAFERAYGACVRESGARARWWEAATFVRLAALYGLRRRWRHLVPGLMRRAVRSLESQVMLAILLMAIAAAPRLSRAEALEYLRIQPHVGQAVEISGKFRDGCFVATDVEVQAQARLHPQLRGGLDAVDAGRRSLVLFGVAARLTGDPDSVRATLAALRPGQRVEVSCAVDTFGTWTVRRMRTTSIKASDKIKGTITRAAVDAAPPDTVEIAGLRVLLVATTEVNMARRDDLRRERILFPDLARVDPSRQTMTLAGDKLRLIGEYRGQVRSRADLDLSSHFDSDTVEGLSELRLGIAGYGSESVWGFAQLQLLGRSTLAANTSATLPADYAEARVSQLYVLLRSRGSFRAALQVGRQDFDEPREWIFDEYLDAAHLVLYGPKSIVLDGAFIRPFHPINPAFETWVDGFAMARLYFDSRSHVAAWVLARNDRDPVRERRPVWIGARYWGPVGESVRPWLDVAVMRGQDKHRTLRAWALDAGATWIGSRLPVAPAVTAGYAVGSGDASTSDGVDGNFRQTGYEDNWARTGGIVSHKIYGSLLDPELSNLEVVTLGLGSRPIADTSLEVIGYRYRQRAADDALRGSNLVDPPARPNGASRDLGWSIELVAAAPSLWGRVRATWTWAYFHPGDAFSPRHRDATWNQLELTARF